MENELNYKVEEINCYHDINKLCVGYIVECKPERSYGIICQFKGECNNSECKNSGLYYFKKDKNFVIPAKTIVTFIKDFIKNRTKDFEVTNICLLSDYINYIVSTREEKDAYYSTTSTPTMEKLMSKAKNFLIIYHDEEGIILRLYYPIINESKQIITYYFLTSCISSCPYSVLDCIGHNLVYKEYIDYPSLTAIQRKLNEVFEYVNSLSESTIIDSFSVSDNARFQSRPGKDDHFTYFQSRNCSFSDKYLHQLTDLGSKLIYFDCCQGSDDEDFHNLNYQETANLRAVISRKYNKSEHAIFLISSLLNEFEHIHEMTKTATYNLSKYSEKVSEIIKQYNLSSLNEWMEIISEYNQSQ